MGPKMMNLQCKFHIPKIRKRNGRNEKLWEFNLTELCEMSTDLFHQRENHEISKFEKPSVRIFFVNHNTVNKHNFNCINGWVLYCLSA